MYNIHNVEISNENLPLPPFLNNTYHQDLKKCLSNLSYQQERKLLNSD
nr:MAG TPA: hypothetical protein [Caudoviricetes sp.]DAV54021.1 MAG TPA: hypothetical protein [Caudoviricetes sp.]